MGHLVALVTATDGGVRRHACLALAAVSGHSAELAEAVVAADAFPRALTGLKFPADERVRRAAATLVREVRLQPPPAPPHDRAPEPAAEAVADAPQALKGRT